MPGRRKSSGDRCTTTLRGTGDAKRLRRLKTVRPCRRRAQRCPHRQTESRTSPSKAIAIARHEERRDVGDRHEQIDLAFADDCPRARPRTRRTRSPDPDRPPAPSSSATSAPTTASGARRRSTSWPARPSDRVTASAARLSPSVTSTLIDGLPRRGADAVSAGACNHSRSYGRQGSAPRRRSARSPSRTVLPARRRSAACPDSRPQAAAARRSRGPAAGRFGRSGSGPDIASRSAASLTAVICS